MVRWFKAGVFVMSGLGAGWGIAVPGAALAQTVEKDVTVTGPRGASRTTDTVRGPGVFDRSTTVTGPRGNSVSRSFDSTRGPGGMSRQATVTGPRGGSISRDLSVRRTPILGGNPGFARPLGPGFGPPRFGPPPVIVGGGGGNGLANFGIGAGLGALGGVLVGSALASRPAPPPAVVYAPPPAVIVPGAVVPGPPTTVIVNQPAPPPANPGFDPVADAVGRLKSWHENSRRDGCVTLGRLRDPRAIPALVDRLKNDNSKDVRIAAVNAIGEIGDPQGAVVLQRTIIYDKKQEVRDAAAAALARMPKELPQPAVASGPSSMPTRRALNTPQPPLPPAISSTPSADPIQQVEHVPPDPTPVAPDPNYKPN